MYLVLKGILDARVGHQNFCMEAWYISRMDEFSKELDVAKKIARQAGKVMLKYFSDEIVVERKDDDSPVTLADIEINHLVIEELGKQFDDGVVGEEESTAEYGMGRRWICDPIDGTRAFTWGLPTAMFSLGLTIDGVPAVGVVYDPFLDLLYEATRDGDSLCNDRPIHVSSTKITGASIAVSGSPEKLLKDSSQSTLLTRLVEKKVRIVGFSGSVYRACLVARGRLAGYVEKNINTHDLAAVEVILKKAGGMITDFEGRQLDYSRAFKGAVISNSVVHRDLLECVGGLDW